MKKITKNQLDRIEDAVLDGTEQYHKLLEKITGITANPYTAYIYYDSDGNYVGNSEDSTLSDMLEAAYIEVTAK